MSYSKKAVDSLIAIFDKAISRTPKPGGGTPSIKPSMLGTACMRKLYYSYNKVSEDFAFPIETTRVTELGTAIGQYVASKFRKAGVLIDYVDVDGKTPVKDGEENREFPIEVPELSISKGFIDLVLNLNGKIWLGEVKSINSFGFGKLKSPKSDHVVQGVLYLYVFNKLLREGRYAHIPQLAGVQKVEGIRYIYYNKDNSTMKEYMITEADDVFKNIVFKIENVKEFTKNGILPDKTPEFCNSCAWRLKCDKNLKL